MKTISLGDIHGTSHWKKMGDIRKLINKNNSENPEYDYYIFLGDYVDSFVKTNIEILDNLKEIINFKKQHTKNVILLWGNHDIQYLTSFNKHGCSGFRGEAYFDLHKLFNKNKELFQLAFQIKNYLWTHAGISDDWYKHNFRNSLSENVANDLNKCFLENDQSIFDVGYLRGGMHLCGGPLWADKRETHHKPLKGFHQIVGHTRLNEIEKFIIDKDTSITYIDLMESENPLCYKLSI